MSQPAFPDVNLVPVELPDPVINGAGLVIGYATIPTLFGNCFIAACEQGIVYLGFPASGLEVQLLQQLQKDWPQALVQEDRESAKEWGRVIFTPGIGDKVNLLVKGTPFQLQVWQALLRVSPGTTTSYAQIAQQIGRPRAFRAVGTAVGRNPVSYLIPCHRVLPQSGGIGHYLWGDTCKRQILEWEGLACD